MTDHEYEREIAAINVAMVKAMDAGNFPSTACLKLQIDAYRRLCDREYRRAYDAAAAKEPA